MIYRSWKYLCMGANLHGPTDKIVLPWSSWTGYYAQLIGWNCFQIVCCKVFIQTTPTTVQSSLDYRTARRARGGFILKFSGLNWKGFRLQSRMHGQLYLCLPAPSRLSKKFRAVAKSLQSWSHKKVGHVNSQLSLAREILHMLEIAQDNRNLTDQEIWLRNRLEKHSLALSSLRRTIARSRSRIGWLGEGDANTALFHLHAQHRKRKKFIARIVEGNQVL